MLIPLGCMIVLIGIAVPGTSWSRPFVTDCPQPCLES